MIRRHDLELPQWIQEALVPLPAPVARRASNPPARLPWVRENRLADLRP